jgi:hypothetical protein
MKRNSTKAIVQCMFSIVAVMLIQITNAQIVYTDVNPDVTTSGTYNLDLNNDGTIDFVIAHTSKSVIGGKGNCKGQTGTNYYIRITPLNNNQVLDAGTNARKGAGTNARKMASSQTIDANATYWSNNIDQVMFSSEYSCAYYCFYGGCGYYFWPTNNGEWYPNGEDGFLGLRLISGGQTFYGWVRMNISSDWSVFTVKDYAYNGSASQAIFAGQSSTEYLEILSISNLPNYFCAGNNITLPYVMAGSFSSSNLIVAELSDVAGSFANPVVIGSIPSNYSGNINAVIPGLTPSGYGYRIRLRSSDPVRISYSVPLYSTVEGGLPIGSISTGGDTNLCNHDSVISVYMNAYHGNGSCYSYRWQRNGIDIPGATSDNYSTTVTGEYTCILTNGAGSVTSNTITVVSIPLAATIIASPENTVCGEIVSLYNTGARGSYQWKLDGNNISGATGSSYNPTVSGNYSCNVTNICGSSTSNTISVSISQPPMANAVITAMGPTVICSGTVMLNANAGSGLSYQWYDVNYPYSTYNPKIIPGATSSSYAASVTGVYIVMETNSAGCSSGSNYIVALIGNPHPDIYTSSSTVCQGSPVNLYAEPSGYVTPPGVSYSYQWIKDGVDISNATAQNYTAKKPGTYSVRVTLNSGGCSGTSAGAVITNGCNTGTTAAKSSNNYESVNPGLNDIKLQIYPNPVSSSATISFSLSDVSKVSLTLFDINGRLIKRLANMQFHNGSHQITLDTKELNSGIYLLRMQSSESIETRKIIVMK